MQAIGEQKRINPNAMEELRQNPEKYLSQIDFNLLDQEYKPDHSILYDNQIIDLVIEKTTDEIMKLCDTEKVRTQADYKLGGGFNILNDETSIVHESMQMASKEGDQKI